jgi:8-oxo-dGTP diphosphatase
MPCLVLGLIAICQHARARNLNGRVCPRLPFACRPYYGMPMPAPRTPPVATDTIIELIDRPGRPIVLIERKNPPHGWALPGGFVEIGESVESAAAREAAEETGLRVELKALLGVYSDPARDPRGHTISVVYVAAASGEPQAADDAASARVFELSSLPAPLAFDHARILEDYRAFRETGRQPALRKP